MKKQIPDYVQAYKKPIYTDGTHPDLLGSTWFLDENTLWNIPKQDMHFEHVLPRGPWHIVSSITGLAMDAQGKIYGLRTMSNPRESDYQLEGQISIKGKRVRAFTSSALFERANGSLCDVAILYVCWPAKEKDIPERAAL